MVDLTTLRCLQRYGINVAKCILFALVLLGAFTCRLLCYREKWAKRRQVKAKTRSGKEYIKPNNLAGLCEASDRECCGREVGLFADAAGHGIQLCAQHEAEYVKNPTPEGDETR